MRKGWRERRAVVVGSGPNGLVAAIALAEAGWSVSVYEAKDKPGGSLRSEALTLPGFIHDVGASVLGLADQSPALRRLPLAQYGFRLAQPRFALAHPFDDGTAALVSSALDETVETLGRDGAAWRSLMQALIADWAQLLPQVLGPLPLPPRAFGALARFGVRAVLSARAFAHLHFREARARALFAGFAAHACLPLEAPISAAFGLVLAANAHLSGWPVAVGGSQRLADVLVAHLRALGGTLQVETPIRALEHLPAEAVVLCDVTPRQFVQLAGEALPQRYRMRLARYRYGPGVFKMDFALREPIPWRAASCREAGTVHLGGTFEEIARSEDAVARGYLPESPYVIVVQPTACDPSRAPSGYHTAWAYCHVPNGCDADMSARIEAQIERFAPGFRDCVMARATFSAVQLERWNPNCIGGDINGGLQDWRQLYARPVLARFPYRTPLPGVYLCSASTPPGGGVHGMAGWHAAQCALRDAERT